MFFLRLRRPPISTRTDTLCPYTTLFRSPHLYFEASAVIITLVLLGRTLEDRARADRKSTRLNSSHSCASRMPSSASKKKKTHQQPHNITYHSMQIRTQNSHQYTTQHDLRSPIEPP